jgi:AdoMet-dependent heme synthase
MSHSEYTVEDFAVSPLMFYYEVTLACDLVCKHCRASAQEQPHQEQLATEQSKALIDQVANFPRKPHLVLTGGDPLKRSDLFDLIRHAVGRGLQVALTPSATPLATRAALQQAKDAGVSSLGISLDGADAETHDAFRGWEGSFERTMRMLDDARELGFFVQVNTTITRRNVGQVDAIAALLAGKTAKTSLKGTVPFSSDENRDSPPGIGMWSVFFLIPVGRGKEEQRIAPEEYETVFEHLWHHARQKPFAVKTTEAPHYRRYVLQQGGDPLAGPGGGLSQFRAPSGTAAQPGSARSDENGTVPLSSAHRHRAPLGVGDGKGIMFVSHTGEIFPAGFLPLLCGRFPADSVVAVYQNHPTFLALREPDRLKGRCGICEYRRVCGGSRARAYAVTGDPLESEPDCVYIPNCALTSLIP